MLQLIAEGHTSKEIASQPYIATKTVETHRLNIMSKLEIHDIAELTKFAIPTVLPVLIPEWIHSCFTTTGH